MENNISRPYIFYSIKDKQGNKIKEKHSICVTKEVSPLSYKINYTKYIVRDGKIPVGFVGLIDTLKGVKVSFIKNYNPEKYSGFGKLADQIEVEHCINRGLDYFEITSNAALNSHAFHYLRGKRFGEILDETKKDNLLKKFKTYDVNKIVENIIKNTKKGTDFYTKFLGEVPMFMPQKLIEKYRELAKKCPILK